jgi:hypothetical protein
MSSIAVLLAIMAATNTSDLDAEYHQETGPRVVVSEDEAAVVVDVDCNGCIVASYAQQWLDAEGRATRPVASSSRLGQHGEQVVVSPRFLAGTVAAIEVGVFIETEPGRIRHVRRVAYFSVTKSGFEAASWVDFACSTSGVRCFDTHDGLKEVHLEYE